MCDLTHLHASEHLHPQSMLIPILLIPAFLRCSVLSVVSVTHTPLNTRVRVGFYTICSQWYLHCNLYLTLTTYRLWNCSQSCAGFIYTCWHPESSWANFLKYVVLPWRHMSHPCMFSSNHRSSIYSCTSVPPREWYGNYGNHKKSKQTKYLHKSIYHIYMSTYQLHV